MNTAPSTYERNRLRQSLIQLASLLVLTLLACGLISLFSLWWMQRLHIQAEARQRDLLQALNSARTAQVAFKIQVQSWKNLLLRGQNPPDYDNALREFRSAEQATRQNLQSFSIWARHEGKSQLASEADHILERHSEAGRGYQVALPESRLIIARRDSADAAVRGIDRPINTGLDQIVVNMLAEDESTGAIARNEENRRFTILSRVVWASMGISLLLISALLWRTLRDPALKG